MSKKSKQKASNHHMSKEERLLLRKRAIQLANERQFKQKKAKKLFLQIILGNDEHYGIPYKYMDEILHSTSITPIPQAAEIIAGVISYRGELIAVLNLAQMLHVTAYDDTDKTITSSNLVIVTVKKMQLALFVNEVIGNIHYQPELLDHTFQNKLEIESDPITGIHNGKIAIIDLPTLLKNHQILME